MARRGPIDQCDTCGRQPRELQVMPMGLNEDEPHQLQSLVALHAWDETWDPKDVVGVYAYLDKPSDEAIAQAKARWTPRIDGRRR